MNAGSDDIRVMIVDDEPTTREYLENYIDWNALGMRVCCVAKNGREACEFADMFTPDIVLMDINMPFINGLQSAEYLYEKLPETVVIFLTGYNEFEYVRTALKIGAADYILKPLEDEELIAALKKTGDTIAQTRELQSVSKKHFALAREMILNLLISNSTESEDVIRNHLELVDVTFGMGSYYVITCEIERTSESNEGVTQERYSLEIKQALGVLLGKDAFAVFNDPQTRIVCIARAANGGAVINPAVLEILCGQISDKLGVSIVIGVGTVCGQLNEIRQSYKESLAALQNRFAIAGERVICYEKLSSEGMQLGFYSSDIRQKLDVGLRTNNWERVGHVLKDVFAHMKEHRFSPDGVFTVCLGLISQALSHLVDMKLNVRELFGDDFSPFIEVQNKKSIGELENWMLLFYKKILEQTVASGDTRSKKLTAEVIKHIEINYSDSELSLGDIARRLYVNKDYLRGVFKKEMSVTLSDYITAFRMQKARELIETKRIKLAGVSELVGYKDAGYFGKCFKKHFGTSPSQYAAVNSEAD